MSKWEPTAAQLERAISKTEELRSSPKAHWIEIRQRLENLGVRLADVVLAEWHPDGQHFMTGNIATRDGRLFRLDVTYDFDREGHPLPKGVGWINSWEELRPEEIKFTPAGYPNSWAQAKIVSQMIFDS